MSQRRMVAMETPEQTPSNGHRNEPSWVNDSAHKAWDRTRGAVSELKRAAAIEERVNRNPYGTVAAALGIGYVLGGGIFTPLTSRIVGLALRIGVRVALLPMLTDEISALADAVTGEGEVAHEGRRRGGKAAKTGSER